MSPSEGDAGSATFRPRGPKVNPPPPQTSVSGIILAGGKSRRMGQEKAFLTLGGRPLIEIVLERIRAVADEVIVVTNSPQRYAHLEAKLAGDVFRGVGVLGGMHAGLTAARFDYSLVVACDMPFLNSSLLAFLASLASDHDIVVPRVDGLLEPLHAVYCRSCISLIENKIAKGQRKAYSFYPQVNVRHVERHEIARIDPGLLSLWNANTPEDWHRTKHEYAERNGLLSRALE